MTYIMSEENDFASYAASLVSGKRTVKRKKDKTLGKPRSKTHGKQRGNEVVDQPVAVDQPSIATDQLVAAEQPAAAAASPPTDGHKTIDAIVQLGRKLWKAVIKVAKETPDFKEWADKKKLEHFRNGLGYEEFMNEFPIVARYMICMGQFKARALRRMLDKMSRTVDPPVEQQAKNYREDLFCKRQADYIRFLWEEYQSHPNPEEGRFIWQDAYKRLKGEFDDFRDMYDDTKKRIEEEKEKYKAQNAKELLERLSTGLQHLPEQQTADLVIELENRVFRRRFNVALQQLLTVRPEIAAMCEAMGCGPEEAPPQSEDDQRRTIRMIEHVDQDRVNEIPRELIVDPETDPYLKKMREMQRDAVEV